MASLLDAVFCIGDPRPDVAKSVAVCEGVKDAFALAARLSVTVIAFLGAPGRSLAPDLARYESVDLYPDSDERGVEWSQSLAPAIAAYGASVRVCHVSRGSDPGDAGAPLPIVSLTDSNQAIEEYVRQGYETRDAKRMACALAVAQEARRSQLDDGILQARATKAAPEQALEIAIGAHRALCDASLQDADGRLDEHQVSALDRAIYGIEAAVSRPIDADDRVTARSIEESLLKRRSLHPASVRFLEQVRFRGMRYVLAPPEQTELTWHINKFWPMGSLCAIYGDRLADAAVRMIRTALREASGARFAFACPTARPSWIGYLARERGAGDNILCAPMSGAGALWADGGFTTTGRLLLGECVKNGVVGLVVDGAFKSCVSERADMAARSEFCAAMRSWSDRVNISVLFLLDEPPQTVGDYHAVYQSKISGQQGDIAITRVMSSPLPTLDGIVINSIGASAR